MIRKNFLITTEQSLFLAKHPNQSEVIRRILDNFIKTVEPKTSASSSKVGDHNE